MINVSGEKRSLSLIQNLSCLILLLHYLDEPFPFKSACLISWRGKQKSNRTHAYENFKCGFS